MSLPISIVIPTFNEERDLPKLLASIANQTRKPAEVIVSDAFSEDNTRKVAAQYGAKVIDGGLPAASRNNGAKSAAAPIILFLDADVTLPKSFLEKCFDEMTRRNLDITSCFLSPRSTHKLDHFFHGFGNFYMRITQKFHPRIPGACIFVKKKMHISIGGFDESIILAEDFDYVERGKKIGKFGYLRSYKIPISVRRFLKEGRIKMALKYVAIELHLIFLGKVRRDIFKYKFGIYGEKRPLA